MKLGDKILEFRKKKGFSQEELGEMIGVTRQTISNWELGETSPNPDQLKLLSKYLNASIDELLDNDIKNVLVEKVSNTEKLAGLILKIIKIVLIAIPAILVLLIILSIVFKNIRHDRAGRLIEDSIYCQIYGEEHTYAIAYQELTGQIVAEGGDVYFADILDLGKYSDAHQVFNVINDYVKKNGGTCRMIENNDLNDLVNMQIKEGTLSKTGATIIINEDIDYDITYGEEFWLEKYNSKNNSYEKLTMSGNNCGFNMIGYLVTPDNPLELTQDWSCLYGKLNKGSYRLVKNVHFESNTIDKYYIWVQFEIEE